MALLQGTKELEVVLAPVGFVFSVIDSGSGSGGPFAAGEFRRQDRKLELHFRFSLGLVSYQVGELVLSHSEYVRAVKELRGGGEQAYPGFSSDPMAAFIDLRQDLKTFGEVFLRGTDEDFIGLTNWVSSNPRARGVNAS